MADSLVWKIGAGSKVKLQDYDPGYTAAHLDHASADQEVAKLSEELKDEWKQQLELRGEQELAKLKQLRAAQPQ